LEELSLPESNKIIQKSRKYLEKKVSPMRKLFMLFWSALTVYEKFEDIKRKKKS